MTKELCNKEKDHPDFGGFCLGAIVIGFITLIICLIVLPEYKNVVVYRNNDGLVCKQDKFYPKENCKQILKDFGPRLNKLKVSK